MTVTFSQQSHHLPWQFSLRLMPHKTTLLGINCTIELKNLLVMTSRMSFSIIISGSDNWSLVTRTFIFTLFKHRY